MRQVTISAMRLQVPLWLMLPALLAACDPAKQATTKPLPEPGVLQSTRNGPRGAAEGTCWGRTVSPAVVETTVEQVQVTPAKVNPDGTIAAPPRYRTNQRQEIVTPRRDSWFETPCSDGLTPEFNASLQRALSARGYYQGDITGEMDARTRDALQAFQRIEGPDSGVLSLAAARKLGLIAVERQPSE